MVRRALFSTVATACLKVPEFKGEFLVAVAVSIDTQAVITALRRILALLHVYQVAKRVLVYLIV